jgi:1-acyl-sn-glycerol-3-phosphate acyltransferase
MVLKGSLRWIPFVGNALSAIGFVFLSRSWESDKTKLRKAFSNLKTSDFGYWLASHPEGTRLNAKKLEEANAFAKAKGLPQMKNVLLPRVKGFYAALSSLRDQPTCVVDMTIAYESRPANPFGFLAGTLVRAILRPIYY